MCEDEFYYVEDMHLCWSQPVYVHNTCGFCGGRTNVTVDIQLRECVQCQALQHSRECGHSVSAQVVVTFSEEQVVIIWIFFMTLLLCHSLIAEVTKKEDNLHFIMYQCTDSCNSQLTVLIMYGYVV